MLCSDDNNLVRLFRMAESFPATATRGDEGSVSDLRSIGRYVLTGELDTGGSGSVYRARLREEQEDSVAIKLAKREAIESAEESTAFCSCLCLQQSLQQANIQTIHEVGTLPDGRPYAVMPLRCGTLAGEVARARYVSDQERALDDIVKVTRAIAHAHQRGIIHRDLKPANILLDEHGGVFVTDFGLAYAVRNANPRHGALLQGGSRGWMSPEQVQGQQLTLASDVFSLGALLYWMLTGQVPFGTGPDFFERVVQEPAPVLRPLYRGPYAWELEQICLRALQKEPERRYRSAAELADDLENARVGWVIECERKQRGRCLMKWMRRNKLLTLIAIEACLALFYLPLMPLSMLREVTSTVRDQVSFSALAQAGAVMSELQASARRIEELALDPEIQRLVQHDDPDHGPVTLGVRATGLDGLSAFSAEGTIRARWPGRRGPPLPFLDYSFRDYFRGHMHTVSRGRRDAYVARPFLSTGDDEPILGLSTPLYHEGRHIGALMGWRRVRATFGSVRMQCGSQGTCMTALLGLRDRDLASMPLPSGLFVLAAPGMKLGQVLMIDSALSRRICAKLDCMPRTQDQFAPPTREQPLIIDDYPDPVSGAPTLAALASVGRTGLIVVVATPHDALNAITRRMIHVLVANWWLPLTLGLLLFSLVALPDWAFTRSRLARRTATS